MSNTQQYSNQLSVDLIQDNVQASNGTVNRIVRFKGKTFRQAYVNRNGSSSTTISVMIENGTFEFVAGEHYLGLHHDVSYVADNHTKLNEAKYHFSECDKWIEKIY